MSKARLGEMFIDEAANIDSTILGAVNERLRDKPAAFIVTFRSVKHDRSSRGKANRAKLRMMRRFYQVFVDDNAESIYQKTRDKMLKQLIHGDLS